MKSKEKADYLAPKLTAVSFKAEKGYALSNLLVEELQLITLDDAVVGVDPNSQTYVEAYETGNGWTTGSNHFWD